MASKKKPEFNLNFVSEIFAEYLSVDEKSVLALHIEYLLLGVTHELLQIFQTEISSITKEILPYIVDRELYISKESKSKQLNSLASHTINLINKGLRKKGMIYKYHATTFMSSTLQYRKYNTDKYQQYKLLVLLCVTRLARMGKHNSAIHSILKEIRLLSTGKRDELLPHLPQPNINKLKILIDDLDEKRRSEYIGESIKKLLSYYFVPFNNAYEVNHGREHKRKSSERTVTTIVESPQEREDEDDEGYVVHRLKTEVKENNKVKDYWETEEENNIAEKIQAFSIIKDSSFEPVEHTRRSMKAKNIVDRLSMRNQSLSCDYKILTAHEITKLLTCILNDLSTKGNNCNNANTLLFCVLFGRTPCELEEMQSQQKTRFMYDKKRECWKLKIKHSVRSSKQEEDAGLLISAVSDHIDCFLPEFISLLLNKRLSVATTEEVQHYLADINKKNHTRLSIPRIASYFVDFCKDKNIDPVILEVISQAFSRQNSAIPYSHITQKQIMDILDLFFNYLNNLLPKEHNRSLMPNVKLNIDEGISIGSPLMLKDDEIIKVNQQDIHHLKELSASKSLNINSQHNKFVFYIYKMLTLASGYRAVTGTGGKFSDINFISNEYWISDKENRDRDSARIIVLPDMVIQQLEEYKRHLFQLKYQVKFSAISIAKRIDDILANTEHLLFFILNDEQIVEISPKTIKSRLESQFPVPLNWNRHYMRSKFMALNISPPLIYHFMGHDDIGSEGMGRYSGLSFYDFKGLATKINTILEELKFEVVKGL